MTQVPGEETVTGQLELCMTEVPCLSCMCAMALGSSSWNPRFVPAVFIGLPVDQLPDKRITISCTTFIT